MKANEIIQIGVIGALVIGGAVVAVSKFSKSDEDGASTVQVEVPQLSAAALKGKQSFDKNCASCHGENAAGTEVGPPLVHDIYNPGHHSDAAFYSAVQNGVAQHHWPYGPMPPRPEVRRHEVTAIIQYVRELQRANGIVFREHRM